MHRNNARLGILLMLATTLVFAIQDGISRHLAETYNVMTVVMFRYWFFAAFVLAWAHYRGGGVRHIAHSAQPMLQACRGLLLVVEICVAVTAYTMLGLIETHAVFACYPLLVIALSGPILGESVGWRRWLAVGFGFVGVVIILRPGSDVFSIEALVPLAAALMFALYSLLTRYVARKDRAMTSLFWTGVSGGVAISLIAPFYWTPMVGYDWWWMLALCITGVLGHFLLIKALEVADTSTTQPFAYFHLVFAALIGLFVFGESLDSMIVVGASLIVASGLFTIWRNKVRQKQLVVDRVIGAG